jgi:hypothetical protein
MKKKPKENTLRLNWHMLVEVFQEKARGLIGNKTMPTGMQNRCLKFNLRNLQFEKRFDLAEFMPEFRFDSAEFLPKSGFLESRPTIRSAMKNGRYLSLII